ncbi:MAG: xylulokinase [Anaerolineaceae bacterium]|jgi:xylulokinase|nr:xylulokinase [Anaerolineaceae bacterium]MDD4042882.1 xylulokinase [Anaerolineaceae bacterium]MDD4577126.1 xylulokinase [Anaerolineaceae bacterium]
MAYYLGIDVSTTSSKALIIDQNGEVLGTTTSPHTLSSPKPLWSEQDPEEWWQAVIQSIQQVITQTNIQSTEIDAIGLTGQMHGLVLLDEHGEVLRPAILWNDQRCQPQCDEIHQKVGKERFIQISGNVALPGFTAPKILWVAENEPEVYTRARHVLLPKDFIRYKLTGEYAMDKADGSGTVLFDLNARDWSDELLDTLGIPREWMPPTYEGPEITGRVTGTAAALTGLSPWTPVTAGGGDQAAGAVGVGAVEPGIVGLVVGTSGVIFATTPEPLIEPEGRLHAFCHAVPGLWHFMGVMLSAAGSLQWYRDTLALEMSFDELLLEAESVPAGSEGLLFLPYLSGERTPHPDPLARGAFIGLTLRHSRGHMTRAVLEGVAFGLKDCFNLILNAGLQQISQVRASGGGTKGALWRQILADVLESELVSVNTTEGGAFGAALLAGVGLGAWSDVQTACRETIHVTGTTTPNPENYPAYRASYQVYSQLYPLLKNTFQQLK